MKKNLLLPAVILLFPAIPLFSEWTETYSTKPDDPETLESILGGFESEEPESIESESEDPNSDAGEQSSSAAIREDIPGGSSPFSLSGRIGIKTGWAYGFEEDALVPFDRRGLSSLKTELYLRCGVELGGDWFGEVSGKAFSDFAYMINRRREYTEEQRESSRQEAILHEAFAAGTVYPGLEIRVGRQIFSFGKADRIQVLDRLNPLDLREPGLQEIYDLKLPVGSVKLSWNPLRNLSFTGVVVPELRQAEVPVYGSEFYPGGNVEMTDRWPESGEEENEYFGSADITLKGWDLSFVYGYHFWDTPRLEVTVNGIDRIYDRVHLAGAGVETVFGPLVLTAEGAFLSGFKFQADPEKDYSRIDLLGGISRQAPRQLDFSIEICFRHYPGLEENILTPFESADKSSWESSVILGRGFMHERLHFNIGTMIMGLEAENGGVVRVDGEWEFSDGLKAKLTWADYLEGERGIMKGAGDNDRITLTVTRSF